MGLGFRVRVRVGLGVRVTGRAGGVWREQGPCSHPLRCANWETK